MPRRVRDPRWLQDRSGVNLTAKLISCALVVAVTSAAMLVIRHRRHVIVNQTIRTYEAIERNERLLWELRTELADWTTEGSLRELIEASGFDGQPMPDSETTIDLHRPPTSGLAEHGQEGPGIDGRRAES